MTNAPTPNNCFYWDDLINSDVGTTQCIYGRIIEIRRNPIGNDNYEYVIRFSIPDEFLYKGVELEGFEVGDCIEIEGEIQTNNQYLFIQAESENEINFSSSKLCN